MGLFNFLHVFGHLPYTTRQLNARDAVWREAARTGSPLYDVEIRAVGAAWRAGATGSAERRPRGAGPGAREPHGSIRGVEISQNPGHGSRAD